MHSHSIRRSRSTSAPAPTGTKRSRSLVALAALAATLAVASASPAQPVQGTTTIQLLNVSDWHAQIDPISVLGVGDVGGAAVLSSYFQRDRAANRNTLTITAGDAFGASPPLSALFDEEPAIRAMNAMGFSADTLGNHNFDRGTEHLKRMMDLASFPYVSANLSGAASVLPKLRPYVIKTLGGVKVAIVGITNPEAPTLVFPGRFGPIRITEPVAAAERARAAAAKQGAKVFVAIAHMGVTAFVDGRATGPLIDFARKVRGFQVIIGDHTDVQWGGRIGRALVFENRSKGLTYSKATLTVDRKTGRVVRRTLTFVSPVATGVTPDAAVVSAMAPFRTQLAAKFDGKIGVATGIFERGANVERLREVALGNLVADSMRERYGTQLAFTNGGGLRAPLPSTYLPADKTLRRPAPGYAAGPPFDLTVGDAYAVLPFGNAVVTRTITGERLWQVLEHSVAPLPAANGRFAQISGFRFRYDVSKPAGSRIVSVTLASGQPIARDGTAYTLATNDFVNAGGDGYSMLADGQGTTRELMADVLIEHIKRRGTISPAVEGRIQSG